MALVFPLKDIVASIADHPKYFTHGISDDEIDALEPLVDADLISRCDYYSSDDGDFTNLYSLIAPLEDVLAYIDAREEGRLFALGQQAYRNPVENRP